MRERPIGSTHRLQAVGVEEHGRRLDSRAWPLGFSDPAAGALLVPRCSRNILTHEHAQLGRVHDSRGYVFQPMIPPPQRFLQEAIGGPRGTPLKTEMMSVRTDEAYCRNLQIRQHARDGVGIAIEPPAARAHTTFGRAV